MIIIIIIIIILIIIIIIIIRSKVISWNNKKALKNMGNLIKNIRIFNLKRQIIFLLFTFFCSQFFLRSSEQQEKHIQELIIVSNIFVLFVQKYYNATTLSIWVVYT